MGTEKGVKRLRVEILLEKLAVPAQRAIRGAGVETLEQLSRMTREEALAMHGIGQKATRLVEATLAEYGMAFSAERKTGR